MLVIDVSLNILASMTQGNPTRLFYLTFEDRLEIYLTLNQMLYRYTYKLKNTEQDTIFYHQYLSNALPIINMNELYKEVDWQFQTRLVELLEQIARKLEDINEKLGEQ